MSMETGSASLPPQISPIKSVGSTQETSSTSRKTSGNLSPFSPQTNVDIKNSVADMAGILSKISQERQSNESNLSPQIQKMLNQILEQSFSLESTLSNGLGSTVESQRFSVDQMLTLGRMLAQLGNLSEQGNFLDMDESLQALFKNIKQFFSEQNKSAFEPALLHKFAFELLNGQDIEDVSQELARFLQGNAKEGTSQNNSFNPTDGQRLGNLLKSFFPMTTNVSDTGSQTLNTVSDGRVLMQQEGTASETNPSSNSQAMLKSNDEMLALKDVSSNKIFRQNTDTSTSAFNANRNMQNASEDLMSSVGTGKDNRQGQILGERNEQMTKNTLLSETFSKDLKGQANIESFDLQTPNESNSANRQDEVVQKFLKGNFNGAGKEDVLTEQFRKETILQNTADSTRMRGTDETLPSLKNNAEAMQHLKSLAALLLKDGNLTDKDMALLQNFINQKREFLPEKDAKQLELLLRLCQSNVPAAVRQAAGQQYFSDLSRLWAFMELCDLSNLKEKDAKNLRQASKKVYDFASMVKSSMTSEHVQSSEGRRSMDFMIPLYLGGQEKIAYPTYLHIYDETQSDSENLDEPKKETWLRLCLLTENIGAVDLTFRMYEKTNLDVRVLFSDANAVEDFKRYVPEFQKSFDDSALHLADLKIAMAGAKV